MTKSSNRSNTPYRNWKLRTAQIVLGRDHRSSTKNLEQPSLEKPQDRRLIRLRA